MGVFVDMSTLTFLSTVLYFSGSVSALLERMSADKRLTRSASACRTHFSLLFDFEFFDAHFTATCHLYLVTAAHGTGFI